jgi:chromosome segregation ATPase
MDVEENRYQELAGDPDHLHAMAQHYLTIANGIRSSVGALNAIHDDDTSKSKATDELKSSAQDVADDITKAESRYRITAQALLDYVPTLRSAQSDAHTAVVHIQHYQSDVESTSTALTKANDAVDTAPDSDKDDATTAQSTARTNAAEAVSKLNYWRGQWDAAKHTRDSAAETAKSKINDVVQHHNNGLKNPTHHWWSDAWHWVSDHLDQIAGWLGVASLLLGWVPFLGQALLIATLVVGAIKLAKDIHDGIDFWICTPRVLSRVG